MASLVYKLLLILATVIWGLGFVVMKDAVAVMEPAYLIGVRFGATALILNVVLWKHMKGSFHKDCLIAGGILGLFNFLAFWTQTIGLADTTPGKNAFLTATYCVIVPFLFWAVAHRRPTFFNIVAAVLCIVGIGLVSLGNGPLTMGFGDAMTLLCAVLFAAHIVCVAYLSPGRDILALTVYQFWVGGIMGLLIGACVESPPNLAAITPDFLWNMAYLVIFASCIALVVQNIALAHVPPTQASLFLSLESVFGVIFSVIFYGEQITIRLLAGFALIFSAIIVSEVFPLKPKVPDEQVAPDQAGDLLVGDAMAAGELEEAEESMTALPGADGAPRGK